MSKFLLAFALLLVVARSAVAQTDLTYRGLNLGMTRQEVNNLVRTTKWSFIDDSGHAHEENYSADTCALLGRDSLAPFGCGEIEWSEVQISYLDDHLFSIEYSGPVIDARNDALIEQQIRYSTRCLMSHVKADSTQLSELFLAYALDSMAKGPWRQWFLTLTVNLPTKHQAKIELALSNQTAYCNRGGGSPRLHLTITDLQDARTVRLRHLKDVLKRSK